MTEEQIPQDSGAPDEALRAFKHVHPTLRTIVVQSLQAARASRLVSGYDALWSAAAMGQGMPGLDEGPLSGLSAAIVASTTQNQIKAVHAVAIAYDVAIAELEAASQTDAAILEEAHGHAVRLRAWLAFGAPRNDAAVESIHALVELLDPQDSEVPS